MRSRFRQQEHALDFIGDLVGECGNRVAALGDLAEVERRHRRKFARTGGVIVRHDVDDDEATQSGGSLAGETHRHFAAHAMTEKVDALKEADVVEPAKEIARLFLVVRGVDVRRIAVVAKIDEVDRAILG